MRTPTTETSPLKPQTQLWEQRVDVILPPLRYFMDGIRMRAISVCLTLLALSGCSSYSSNLQVGNGQSYLSLKDQREAVRLVRVYDVLPDGAEVLGDVSAGRCHRSFVEQAPSEATVLTDLKVAAYAQGADGITNISVSKDSALNRNCWYVLGGKATAFMMKQ